LGGACVAYHLQRQSDFAVLAHEGWHQFADARLAYALPAWLDEGLALQFEAYRWEKGQVRFDPRLNAGRLVTLKRVMAAGRPIALADLLRLDAGRVLSHTRFDPADPGGSGVAVYYAQLYGLIRFLREANYGRYRQALQTMLQDGQTGRWPLSPSQRQEARQRQRNPSRLWNAQVGLTLFRTYIGADLTGLQAEYETFCRQITAEIR
ncbi:MAG: hypothetical protein JW810_07800, partial [Sedimentisphaerales bacterium]|nr:hypothetical protein [Sedimentisphaerales bacterium]